MRFQLEHAVEVLQRTPDTLEGLLSGLSDVWLHGDEGPQSWSPFQVVGHLIHGEETDWIPRLKIILESGETKPFEPFDREGFVGKSENKSLDEQLHRFRSLREANLTTLRDLNLSDEQISLTGIHPEFGRVNVGQLLSSWVVHDLGHIGQIVRVMAKNYSDAVGPWQAYLPVLHKRP